MSPHFVSDLIPLILQSNRCWWPEDLIRLAQVSSDWLEPARRLLYATPNIYSFRTCSQLAKTLSKNPALLRFLKGVELRPVLGGTPEERYPSINARTDLKFILALQGLQTITLGGYLAVKAERFLHVVGDPTSVKRLHIDGSLVPHRAGSFPSLEWDESIAYKFACIETLQLTNIELDIMYPSIPYQHHLSDLVLENVIIMNGYLSHLLHETPSLGRLCIQSKSVLDSDEHVKAVLASCSVQVLDYQVQTELPLRSPIFDNDSSHLLSLRCLCLDGISIEVNTLDLISERCRNLEELTVTGRTVMIDPHEWLTFLRTRSLPLLRVIGLPWGTNYPPFTPWCDVISNEVLKTAALNDIEVKRGEGGYLNKDSHV